MKKERLIKVLKEIKMKDIMHCKVVKLCEDKTIDDCINFLIKYKINDLLITSTINNIPIGVISKNDLLGAYYVGLLTDHPISNILSKSIISCSTSTSLSEALDIMAKEKVLSLYIKNKNEIVGFVTYPDIIGVMYKFCFGCPRNKFQNHKELQERFVKAKDVMNKTIVKLNMKDSIIKSVETFLNNESDIILIEKNKAPYGVITKTDVILAYKHKISIHDPLSKIVKKEIVFCYEDDSLIKALKIMIATDVQNLIVLHSSCIVKGFVSLKAAAQLKSGSCKACKTSRDIEMIGM